MPQWNHWGASRRPWVWGYGRCWSYGSITGVVGFYKERCKEGRLALAIPSMAPPSHWCVYSSFPELIPPWRSQNFRWEKWLANEFELVCPVGLWPGNWRLLRLGKLCGHNLYFLWSWHCWLLVPKDLAGQGHRNCFLMTVDLLCSLVSTNCSLSKHEVIRQSFHRTLPFLTLISEVSMCGQFLHEAINTSGEWWAEKCTDWTGHWVPWFFLPVAKSDDFVEALWPIADSTCSNLLVSKHMDSSI